MEQKPSMGRVVLYNHPGSADGKYPPIQSPAIVQRYTAVPEMKEGENGQDPQWDTCDLFVMSNTGGIFFAKNIKQGELGQGTTWCWPPRV